jgi:hypothetical protein
MKKQKSLQHAQDIRKQKCVFITWSVLYGRMPATGWMKNAPQAAYSKIFNKVSGAPLVAASTRKE